MNGEPWFVEHFRKMGFANPCCHCIHLADAVFRRGQDSCGMHEKGCGGPVAGRSFRLMQGIAGRSIVRSQCFVCGAEAKHEAIAKDGGTVGVCDEHKSFAVVYCKIVDRSKRKLAGVIW